MIKPAFIIVLLAGVSTAEPIASDEPTADDVAGALRPGEESGVVQSADPGDSTARRIARGALFVPRVAIDTAFLPLQYGALAVERYQVVERAKRLFFNDAETMGAFPIAKLESGFGVTVGARFVHTDLFGAGAKLGMQTGAGGRFRQLHRASFKTGDLFGDRFALELEAQYERRPKDPFYGVGNGDLVTAAAAPMPVLDELNIESRYRHRLVRAVLVADARIAGDLHTRASGAVTDHAISATATDDAIDRMYAVDELAGYGNSSDVYGELELRWDSRRAASRWEPRAIPAAGSLAAAYVGRTTSTSNGTDFWRFGIDLQHFHRLAVGPRVLMFRAHAEAISVGRDDVPFYELPRLGGSTYLRGYPAERFRDRVAAVGSIDYQWDLSRNLSASVFADAGRVYTSLSDMTLDDMRAGYGFGLQVNTENSFVARMSVASSIDGGVFFDFALDPVFELDRRVERR